MFRRRFLQLVTMASVGGLAPLEAMAAGTSKTVTYFVKGFSCITCATGLDTMLGQQKGMISSKSTYPEGKVTVGFDPQPDNRASHRRLHHRSGLYRASVNTKADEMSKERNYSQLAAILAASLDLQQPPVAICFAESIPAGVKVAMPAVFLRDADSGKTPRAPHLRPPPPTTACAPLVFIPTICQPSPAADRGSAGCSQGVR